MSLASASHITVLSPGRYAAEIAPEWDIAGAANGGYLLNMVGRALSDAAGRGQPVSVSAYYLSPGKPGPVEIAAQVLKRGRTLTTAAATLTAGDRALLHVVGSFGDPSAEPGTQEPLYQDADPPDLPAPDECIRLEPKPPYPPNFVGRVDVRLHPDDAGFGRGAPSGRALLRGWFRLRDGEPHDPFISLLASDAFPPTVFNARLPIAWTPTVELTVHVRSSATPEWLACRFITRFVTGETLESDGQLWSPEGALIAQSRQLAIVARKPL